MLICNQQENIKISTLINYSAYREKYRDSKSITQEWFHRLEFGETASLNLDLLIPTYYQANYILKGTCAQQKLETFSG